MICIWNYLLIMVVTVYIAFMYQSTAMMLLLFVEAALFVVAFFSLLVRCFRVKGQIEVPVGIAERGGDSLIKLRIANHSLLPVNRIRALVIVKDEMRGRKKRYWLALPAVPRGNSEYIRFLSFFGTGNYDIYLHKLKIVDVTGLFSCNIRVKKHSVVQVMPEFHDVPVRLTLAVKNFYGEADVYDENQPGQDNSELFQVRDYRAGDRLQNVHWKLTAKQDELVVKEYSMPKACPVILFFAYRPGKRKQMLLFLEAAASLSFSIMDAGCPHYVVWYDGVEQDIRRIRVDDEESVFYMIGVLMGAAWGRTKEDIRQRYHDKYRHEPYVWALTIDEKLQLYKDKELLVRYQGKKLGTSLGETELLL